MGKKEKTRKPLKLKYKLLLVLVPVVIAYTMILTAVNSGYIMSSTRNSLEKTLGQTADITAEQISQSITYNKKLTTLLASRVGAAYADQITMPYEELEVEAFADEIARLGVNYGFLYMMVAGPDGCTRTTLHTDLVEKNADYYTAIISDGQPSYASDVTVDQGSFRGTYVLNYSAPIRDSRGNTIGVLICKSDAAELSRLVGNICVGENGSTFLMDSHGQCIAHKNQELLFSGSAYLAYKNNAAYPELNALWDAMMNQDIGYMPYDLDGARIAAFTRVDGSNNWSIAVTVAEGEFMQGALDARTTATFIALGMIVLLSLLLALLFRYTTNSILQVTDRLEKLSEGDLTGEVELSRATEETYRLSRSAAALADMIQTMIGETEYALGEIARGNLTVQPRVDYPGDFAAIREAIESNLVQLTQIVQRISRTSEEVARGSAQMASGASGLAQGASEQASSLEELFETVTTLAQRTYEIGGLDKKKLADVDDDGLNELDGGDAAQQRFDAADSLAEKLTIAIARIAEASDSIRRIASTIETISAETSMLALNASVEATHAGDAGRGFSVIASEIRSLSDKSRDAARDADNKIDSISRAVNRGTQTVDVTVETIGEMTVAMDQVKSALEQISNIVENIAATAEETAAGSEELSAQADMLKSLVAEFKYDTDEAEA